MAEESRTTRNVFTKRQIFFLFVNMCSYVCQKILSTYFIPIKSSLTLTYKQLIFNILHICNYYQGDLTHF